MQVAGLGHLSYCSNIHPGETWPQVLQQLQCHLPIIKQQLSPGAPFGIGLRLSAEAARELSDPSTLAAFRQWLDEQALYVFTLNGFPYGNFHGEPVKQAVYRPDWSRAERLDYTQRLAEILAGLLPAGVAGSISTVPGAFKPDIVDDDYRRRIVTNLVATAGYLQALAERTGKSICLALEPEPGCMLETAEETLAFFREELFTAGSAAQLAALTGESPAASAEQLRTHLGVCLDTCHAAVMFEEPLETAQRLVNAGISIAKLQLTAALAVEAMDEDALVGLQAFSDPIYLHQTTVMCNGAPSYYLDLPQACADFCPEAVGSSWRCHYHVPVFLEDLGVFRTTAPALARLLQQHRKTPFSQHLEVETYTFDVLPEQYRRTSVTDNITREIAWVRTQLQP